MFPHFFMHVSSYNITNGSTFNSNSNLKPARLLLENSVTASATTKPKIDAGISVLKVKGYLDMTTAEQLETALASVFRENKYKVIVDLENVEYISSMGWSVILGKIKDFRRNGGDIKLMRMQPNVFEVYRLLEFDLFLDAYNTIDDTVLSFKETNYEY